MSSSPYARNAHYAPRPEREPHGHPGPGPAHPAAPDDDGAHAAAGAAPADLHSAETVGWDVFGARDSAPAPGGRGMRGAHADTYAPAYEAAFAPAYEADSAPAHEPSEPVLPRQVGTWAGAGGSVRESASAGAQRGVSAGVGARAGAATVLEGAWGAAGAPELGAYARRALVEGAPEAGARAGSGRRAARRRKVRYAQRPDSAVRRLLPQALVVAFLAGGTTAFVAKDKAIELTVDGKPRTLHTFADDVTELLAQEGVRVGEHDVVAPAPGTGLRSGDEVAVHYGRPVRLTLDGQRHEVWTTAHTVDEALRQLGVRAEGAYVSVARSLPIGRAGLTLDVRTERSVTIMADGRARTVRTNAATVREAVEEAGITLRGQDTTSVPPGSFPRDGQTVTVLRITGTREVREEAIAYEVRRTEDPTLFKGLEVVERAGQPGLRRVTYALRTVNGVRQRPRRLRTEVVREPRAQLVRVGTKPLPDSVRGADGLDWHGLAVCESGGRPDAVDPSGTYGGLYQFDTHTWHSLGGRGRPQDASAQEQTYRAKKLYLRRGASPWPHCGARLHG